MAAAAGAADLLDVVAEVVGAHVIGAGEFGRRDVEVVGAFLEALEVLPDLRQDVRVLGVRAFRKALGNRRREHRDYRCVAVRRLGIELHLALCHAAEMADVPFQGLHQAVAVDDGRVLVGRQRLLREKALVLHRRASREIEAGGDRAGDQRRREAGW